MVPFFCLDSLLGESPLNSSDGSPDGPPRGAWLGASLEEIIQKDS